MITEAQLQTQHWIIKTLAEQGITNFYLAYNGTHAFYSHSSDTPIFTATSNGELVLAFKEWCQRTPNEDIRIIVKPF